MTGRVVRVLTVALLSPAWLMSLTMRAPKQEGDAR